MKPSIPKTELQPSTQLRKAVFGSSLSFVTVVGIQALLNCGSAAAILTWGSNNTGQLGDGTTEARFAPIRVDPAVGPGPRLIMVNATEQHTLALDAMGRVYGWGLNDSGQIGDGSIEMRVRPVQIQFADLPTNSVVNMIAASDSHSMALSDTGRLFVWGNNFHGQLGDGLGNDRHSPFALPWPHDVSTQRIVGIFAGEDHSFATLQSGKLYGWGRNDAGQLGNGDTTNQFAPVQVGGLSLATQQVVFASGGLRHSIALTPEGRVFTWGDNANGQLGNGSTNPSLEAIEVTYRESLAGSPAVAVAAAGSHSMLLTADGSVLCWGENASGQVGNGSQTDVLMPTRINLVSPSGGPARIVAITTSKINSVALSFEGHVYSWGETVGDGTGDIHVTAVLIDYRSLNPTLRVTGLSRSTSSYHIALLAEREARLDISRDQAEVILHLDGEPLSSYVLERAEALVPLVDWHLVGTLLTDSQGAAVKIEPVTTNSFWRTRNSN
jgi:alpha-tubulin suppressor-like RCC1 family protein